MPKTYKNRIEIYLNSDSIDDVFMDRVWKALSSSGKGRAQSFFRQSILRGIRNIDESDIPEEVRDILSSGVKLSKKRGPKERWKPSSDENDIIDNDFSSEDINKKDIEEYKKKMKGKIPNDILQEYVNIKEEEEPTINIHDDENIEENNIIPHKKSKLKGLM